VRPFEAIKNPRERYGHAIRGSWRLGVAEYRRRNGKNVFSLIIERRRASEEETGDRREKMRLPD